MISSYFFISFRFISFLKQLTFPKIFKHYDLINNVQTPFKFLNSEVHVICKILNIETPKHKTPVSFSTSHNIKNLIETLNTVILNTVEPRFTGYRLIVHPLNDTVNRRCIVHSCISKIIPKTNIT